jgi:hypothetical protein
MLEYIKHLVQCNCVLKQFELIEPPVFHKFVVFSVVNEDVSIKPSYAKCNNCGGIHRVTEVGVSEKLRRESAPTIPDAEEIKTSLPEKLVGMLLKYSLELPTWQEIKFIYENEMWGRPVILHREQEGEERYGKYLVIAGKSLWKIDSFSTEDV